MKKRILLFTGSIVLLSATLMSYNSGPGLLGQNRTGSAGGSTTCSDVGCHAGGSYTNTASLTLFDSTGVTIKTTWQPNHTYKAVLGGVTSAPKIGFQVTSAYFNGSTNLPIGTFSNLSSGLHLATVGGFSIVEQSSAISVTGGYTKNFDWKAPNVTTMDTISFYVTVNCVNGTGNESGDNSTNQVFKVGRNTTSVPEISGSGNVKIVAYPNPLTSVLNISLENVASGAYTINVFDIRGKVIATQNATVSKFHMATFNTSDWAAGMYHVQLSNGENVKTISVVKK